MAILKCKMCGGDLIVEPEVTVCECEYCGTKQTVPNTDDEKKLKLYERANRLRIKADFDKAGGVYESLIEEYPEEAEAYWGNLLCKYGIEYVDDPATGKKVPTCHRSSFDSIMDDPDFDMVMENSDAVALSVYREQAKQIEEIRKGIIEVSGKEQPYDIFICYKETDNEGERTLDSVLAQDVYDALTDKEYRVFFSRISLEDKLGSEYEPYIFAALNSAKIMLAFGTKYEYYNAAWVKNEWSRFLKLMAKDKKKHLIPCYKDIDAYDMPKEFAKLQAQDMGKVGAVQDLLRGIDKLIGTQKSSEPITTVPMKEMFMPGINTNALLIRGNMALEDRDWDKADGFFEEILNQDPKCADAYLGKLLASHQASTLEQYIENQKRKYDECTSEEVEACLPDEKHIAEIAQKYRIKKYFEPDKIKEYYDIPRTYKAELPDRIRQKEKLIEEMKNDRLLYRVKQFITGDLKEQIGSGFQEIQLLLDRRIEEAKAHDQAEKEIVSKKYIDAVKEADNIVAETYRIMPKSWQKELLEEMSKLQQMSNAVEINKYVQNKYIDDLSGDQKKKIEELALLEQWYGKKKDAMIALLNEMATDYSDSDENLDDSQIKQENQNEETEAFFIDPDKCIGCGMCAKECPANSIQLSDYIARGHKKPSLKIDETRCVGCGKCLSACRFNAIEKGSRRELIEVVSPVPGIVYEVKAEEGQTVKNGDSLIVVKALSMEIPVPAPQDGVVESIEVDLGDIVKNGNVLVIMSGH